MQFKIIMVQASMSYNHMHQPAQGIGKQEIDSLISAFLVSHLQHASVIYTYMHIRTVIAVNCLSLYMQGQENAYILKIEYTWIIAFM